MLAMSSSFFTLCTDESMCAMRSALLVPIQMWKSTFMSWSFMSVLAPASVSMTRSSFQGKLRGGPGTWDQGRSWDLGPGAVLGPGTRGSRPHLAKPDLAILVLAAFGQTESHLAKVNWPHLANFIWRPIFVDRIFPDRIWPIFFGGPKEWGSEGVGARRGRVEWCGGPNAEKVGHEGLGARRVGGPKGGGSFFFFSPPGLHTTTRELQTCTFERPSLQKHHQNSTSRPPQRVKKE